MNRSISQERVHWFNGEYYVYLAQALLGCALLAGKFSLEAGAAFFAAAVAGITADILLARHQYRKLAEQEAEQRRAEEEQQKREARKALAKQLAKRFRHE